MNTQFVTELFKEYQERRHRNGSYSQRAFARAIGLSPGFLKLLFQRKKRISADRAREVALRLSWSEQKISFLTQAGVGGMALSGLDFNEISDWHHFAIVEFLRTRAEGFDVAEIRARLDLGVDEVQHALRMLAERGLVAVDPAGRARTLVDNYEVPAMSSSAIRKYHRQTLEKAIRALDEHAFERKEFKALCLAFDPARLSEVDKFMARFIQAFDLEFGTGGNRSAVYQLNLAFHQLDKENAK